ncbi:hypothetical protein N7534_012064 [Penicillium rubens]|nr:hypothetical protein N7534_012064 [Penicillium rubens]
METPFAITSSITKFSDFYVEIGLNGIDPTFWPIFVGDNKRPPNLPGMEDEVFEDTVTEIDDDTLVSDFVLASGSTPISVPTPILASEPAPAPAAKTAITKRVKE